MIYICYAEYLKYKPKYVMLRKLFTHTYKKDQSYINITIKNKTIIQRFKNAMFHSNNHKISPIYHIEYDAQK